MFKNLKKGHWPVFLLSSFSSLGNLFLPIILVRLLTPSDIGTYKIFFLHLNAIPFLFLVGGPMHSVYYWAGREGEERKRYLNASWVLTVLFSVLILVIGLPLTGIVSASLDISSQNIMILLLIGAMSCTGSHFAETNLALGNTFGTVYETILEFIKVVTFLLIAYKTKNIQYIFYFFLIFMTARLLMSVQLNKKLNFIDFKTSKNEVVHVFRYSLPMAISSLLNFFVDKLDLLILSSLLQSSDFAFYSMGCLVVPPLYILEMSVQKTLIPSISKYYLSQDKAASSASFRKAIKDISFLMLPAIFGLIVFGTPIVKLLYTEKYLDSVVYLKIFALSYILLMLPHDSVARATGKTNWILKMYIIIAPLLLLAGFLTAKYYGAIGVLTATIILKFIPKYFGLRLSRNVMGWKWSEMFPVKHLVFFSFICTILSVLSILMQNLFSDSLTWFLICGPIFAVLYLSTAYYFGGKGKYAAP